MSSLATETQQDPSLIKNMIQSNGNGTYSVDFHVGGQDDFVTVNNQLVTGSRGGNAANDAMMFAGAANDMWAGLVEKAYAQLMSQSGVQTFNPVGNIDSYSAIDGGNTNGLTAITGQSAVNQSLTASSSASAAQADLAKLQSAFNSGEGVMLATSSAGNSNKNIVSNHMYAVTGVNALAGTVTLFNPWGDGIDNAGMQASITLTVAQLEKQGVTLFETTGNAAMS